MYSGFIPFCASILISYKFFFVTFYRSDSKYSKYISVDYNLDTI